MPALQFLVANGKRGRRKVVARKSFASRVKAAKRPRRSARGLSKSTLVKARMKQRAASRRAENRFIDGLSDDFHMPRRRRAKGKKNSARVTRKTILAELKSIKGHWAKARKSGGKKKRNPARRYFAALARKKHPVTKAAHQSGMYSFGSLPKVNPRKRAKSGAGAKKMARKRGKLKGKAKAAFLRQMKRGRKKAGLSVGRKHRARRGKKNGHRSVKRRYRSRRNGRPTSAPILSAPRSPGGKKRGRRAASSAATAPKRRRRRKLSRRESSLVKTLSNKIARLASGRKRGKGSKSVLHKASRVRSSALRLRRRIARGGPGVSAKARAYLRIHGLSKVNPSGAGVMASLKAIPGAALEVLAVIGSAGGAAWVGQWAGKKLVAKYGSSWAPFASAGTSLVLGVLGFLGLRMSSKTARYSVPLLAGAATGAVINVLSDNHVAGASGAPALSWGRALDLPIGAVILRSEVNGFDPLARHQVNAMGEVISRREAVSAMGEVLPRSMTLGEAEEAKIQRLLAEVTLQNDSGSGF